MNSNFKKVKSLLGIMHISSSICILPIPYFIWKFRKDNKEIDKHGRDVINFQLSMSLLLISASILSAIVIFIIIPDIKTMSLGKGNDFIPFAWTLLSILPISILFLTNLFHGIANWIRVRKGKEYIFPILFNFI